MLKHI